MKHSLPATFATIFIGAIVIATIFPLRIEAQSGDVFINFLNVANTLRSELNKSFVSSVVNESTLRTADVTQNGVLSPTGGSKVDEDFFASMRSGSMDRGSMGHCNNESSMFNKIIIDPNPAGDHCVLSLQKNAPLFGMPFNKERSFDYVVWDQVGNVVHTGTSPGLPYTFDTSRMPTGLLAVGIYQSGQLIAIGNVSVVH